MARENLFLTMETPRNSESFAIVLARHGPGRVLHVKMFVNTLVQGLEFYGLRQYFNYATACTYFTHREKSNPSIVVSPSSSCFSTTLESIKKGVRKREIDGAPKRDKFHRSMSH